MTAQQLPAIGVRVRRQARRGISLLEVLFSVLVLTVGLLGMSALGSLGGIRVSEAVRMDRASYAGQAALHEIKIRDLLDEELWWDRADMNGEFTASGPFMIDPLGFADNAARSTLDNNYDQFPHGPRSGSFPAADYPRMRRISIKPSHHANAAMIQSQADRVFRFHDDLLFSLPANDDARPQAVNPGLPSYQRSQGDYSWMVMMTPTADGQQNASVVVFHKRDTTVDTSLTSPSERIVSVWYHGGGDVRMFIPASTTAVHDQAKEILSIRPMHWVLLCRQTQGMNPQNLFRWYRVVATSAIDQGDVNGTMSWFIDVTLAGPDWGTISYDSGQNFAVLCDGVVGVFEKETQLDEPSFWTGD